MVRKCSIAKLSGFDAEYVLGRSYVVGIDEAGRGALAGPVVAAAMAVSSKAYSSEKFLEAIQGLDDSKKLTEKKREKLFDIIKEQAIDVSVGIATEKEIDAQNILKATFLAMKRAVDRLSVSPDYALVDGNRNPNIGLPTTCIIKGDATSPSIAAASIIAKVTRDRMMIELDKEFPEYLFKKHKGYGTKLHYEKIKEFGILDVHRRSFLKNLKEHE